MKISKVQQILNDLPPGVKYIGPEEEMTEENVMAYAKNPAMYNNESTEVPEDSIIFESPQPP